jgi:hypothetical protein
MAVVGPRPTLMGVRMAMLTVAPMPGKTPTSVPISAPAKQ